MFKFKLISSLVGAALMINLIVNLKLKSAGEDVSEDTDEEIASDQSQHKKNSRSNRSPASLVKKAQKAAPNQKAEINKTEIDNSNFANMPSESDFSSPAPESDGGYQPSKSTAPTFFPLARQNFNGGNNGSTGSNGNLGRSESSDSFTKAAPIISGGGGIYTGPVVLPTDSTCPTCPTEPTGPTGPTGPEKPATIPNSCSSNIIGGAFSHPIGVNLSCTSTSVIKYCVARDTGAGCCDPIENAKTYSSPIVIGPRQGAYCLSYYGQSSTNGSSTVYQQNYVINSALPDLQVTHPQVNYQTTQLNVKSLINSSDFGKTGFHVGQINLMAHNPGSSSCDDIMETYASLPAPQPVTILSFLDVSLDGLLIVPVEIPLEIEIENNKIRQLRYGDNYITSYIENTNFVAPVYSCSTSKIVLNDFEFFQIEPASGATISESNTVIEFSGGFSPFGPLEGAVRAPASVSDSSYKLKYGMFEMFY